jgi:hypothetical protein
MADNNIHDRWAHDESPDPDDDSRKEVQVIREKGTDKISVRHCYYGPSGTFSNKPPQYGEDGADKETVIEQISKAYDKRDLYIEALREFHSTQGIDSERARSLLDLVEDEEDIEKLKDLAKN